MSGKGGGKGSFVLKRPEAEDDLEHVAAAFKMWLGLPEGGINGFVEKMKGTEISEVFIRDTFDLIMAVVNSHAAYIESKKVENSTVS